MVELVKDPWKTSDGKTFASRAEAEKHEGRVELRVWIEEVLAAGFDGGIGSASVADTIAGAIVTDSGAFVGLLRKAGVKLIVRERTAKVPRVETETAEEMAARTQAAE